MNRKDFTVLYLLPPGDDVVVLVGGVHRLIFALEHVRDEESAANVHVWRIPNVRRQAPARIGVALLHVAAFSIPIIVRMVRIAVILVATPSTPKLGLFRASWKHATWRHIRVVDFPWARIVISARHFLFLLLLLFRSSSS